MAEVVARVSGNLGIIKFSNPPFNFLTSQMLEGFSAHLDQLYVDNKVKAIVVTSEGNTFSAGVDIRFIHSMAKAGDGGAVEALLKNLHRRFDLMSSGKKPVIAAVNGMCWGGGLELVLACNYILVPKDPQMVSFACPEIDYAIITGLGATQRLPRRVDPKAALKMLLGGKRAGVNAEQAHSMGLVDEIVSEEDFGEGVNNFVNRVLSGEVKIPSDRNLPRPDFQGLSKDEFAAFADRQPAFAAYLINSVVSNGLKKPMPEAWLEVELPALLNSLFTPDALEGLSSFVEKRKPSFSLVVGKKESSDPVVVGYAEIPPWEKEEYQMLRDTVREFVGRELKWEKVRQMEEKEEIPRELLSKMGEIGFFGTAFPEEYGGAGLGKIGVCILADELTYAHPATAVVLGAHSSLGCEAIYLFGNEDQKQRYLVPGIKGEKIGALVTTEPGVGSDVGGMKTLAKKVDGGWRLNGSKQFVTNGEIADFIVVFAQTDPLGGNKTLAAFIVDSTPELRSKMKREKKMGIHASRTNSFPLEDMFVPDKNLLGEVGNGFKMLMNIFNHSRVTVAASSIGFIRRAIDEAINYSKNRMLFGEPMYMKQLTQVALAEMEVMRFAVESAVLQAAWRVDRGLDVRNEAAAVKYFGPESAKRAVDMSVQLHGGSGYISDYPIEMFYRDVRIFPLFEGTSQIQLLTIAKEMIKSRIL